MNKAIVWTPEMDTELFRMRQKNYSVVAIAAIYGLAVSTIHNRCREIGAFPPKDGIVPTPPKYKIEEVAGVAPERIELAPRYSDGRWEDPLPPGHALTWGPISMGQPWPNS
jgi:hypothetical protein